MSSTTLVLAGLLAIAFAEPCSARDLWQTSLGSASATKQKELGPSPRAYISNPGLLKEMIRRSETRQQILQDRGLLKEMMANKDLKEELLKYPELRDAAMRDPEIGRQVIEREETSK